jgi:beta-phosphoglucomutase
MNKLKIKPKAVIFDMDGVIVDSMPYHFIAWYEALRPYGVRVNCFDVYSKEGEKWDKSMREFLSRADISPSKKIMRKVFLARKKIFDRYYKRYIFKGAAEILRCLKAKTYRLALVTGTNRNEIEKILPNKIKKLFDCIVSGDSVKRGKPYPDPYIKAAKILGLQSAECVVIENAPYGIISAKKAGMFCIAVTTSLPKEYLNKADIIVDSLEQVNTLLDISCST